MIAETTRQIQISCVGFYISLGASKGTDAKSSKYSVSYLVCERERPKLDLVTVEERCRGCLFFSLMDLFRVSECFLAIQRSKTVC